MILSTAIIFVVVYREIDNELRSQIDRDIAGDTAELALSLDSSSNPDAGAILAAARRGIGTESYRTTDKLLFAAVLGVGATSNDSGLFGGGGSSSRDSGIRPPRPSALGRALLASRSGFSSRAAPGGTTMRMFEQTLTVGNHTVIVGAGESLAAVTRAERSLAKAFIIAGGLALLVALLLAYFAGERISAPLRRMAAVSRRVDAGDLEARMPVPARHDEVRTLTEAFNHMLDQLAEQIDSQRVFIADASHELRTPLTVIRGQLEVLAALPNPAAAEVQRVERLVAAEIARTSRLVDDLLLLAQAERPAFLHLEAIDVEAFVAELWDGMSLTAERTFELGPVPAGTLLADPDRLAQALRNLARNAIENTPGSQGLVRLDVKRLGADRLRFTVSDNGNGIPRAERARIFERFHRPDPARSRSTGGAGLGLAIVRAIAEAHGGSVVAGDVLGGHGASIKLDLPRFTPAPHASALRGQFDHAT
jgi:two-component system OmpR family sensor kinase